MAILVFNVGSSSLKATLFDAKLKRIRDVHSRMDGDPFSFAIQEMGVDVQKVVAVGHRFIHGGWKYTKSCKIDAATMRDLKALKKFAPLHNPECLEVISASKRYFPKHIPQVAVFDTAFHRTLPPAAAHYAIPKPLADKHHIQRYGFHGISYAFLAQKCPARKLIALHLGGGCSAAAILDGKSVDTSMGFSPAEGLVMGTRSGDIDFAVLEYLTKVEKMSLAQVTRLLNFGSGLLGVSGKTADMKTLLDQYERSARARLAIDLFCHRIVKTIGAYAAVLEGADGLVFAGGIGENAPEIREMVCSKLKFLGTNLSQEKNKKAVHLKPGDLKSIHASGSKVKIYAASSDEDLFIAQETRQSLRIIFE